LSTCVNRYGPPPAALDALRCIKPVDLLMHPYDAAERLREVYATTLGIDAGELLSSRAASEVIWAMGRTLDPRTVAIPLPAYTDYLRVFPGRGFGSTTGCGHSIEQLDAALTLARVVLISNPHNPTGSVLGPDELTAVALRHPRSVLVVDESYVEFVGDPTAVWSAARPATWWCFDRRQNSRGSPPPVQAWPGVATATCSPAWSVYKRRGACPGWTSPSQPLL
jgi:histidinol-phosphate/aromatic aminotransferase/cobyric acid decarboxylase-like protein